MQPVPFVLEVSYEVIHKVGGVETVVRSKAPQMLRQYGQNYLMCGPYIPADERYQTVFEDTRQRTPEWDGLLSDFEREYELPAGFVRFGTWLVPGSPRCVLLPVELPDSELMRAVRAKGLDTLNRALELDVAAQPDGGGEPFRRYAVGFGMMQWCLLSFLMPRFVMRRPVQTCLLVQVHEWLAALGLVLFQRGNVQFQLGRPCEYWNNRLLRFVFTTHATTIGRHLSAGGADLSGIFRTRPGPEYADGEACRRGVAMEHRAERRAAADANILTTVSDITNQECTHFLGRSADVVTWNGLDVDAQKGLIDDHELQTAHKLNKQKIYDFVQTYFCGIDVRHVQIFFTAGRNEYNNKGIDLFIDSLAAVRDRLDDPGYIQQYKELQKKTVVALIIAPQANNGFSQHVLQAINLSKEMKLAIEVIAGKLRQNLVDALCGAESVHLAGLSLEQLAGKQDCVVLKRFQQTLKKQTQFTPITTHNIVDENCPILGHLRGKSLINQPLTRVKVIFVPEFLSKTSVFGLDYTEFVRGAHLGVFSSLYEPFGYTSPECMCVGTASILSNLCGFGNLAEKTEAKFKDQSHSGGVASMIEKNYRVSSMNLLSSKAANISPTILQRQAAAEDNCWVNNHLGVKVVDRVYKSYGETVMQQAEAMLDYLKLSMYDRIAMRNRMVRNAIFIDWSVQAREYVRAYDMAIAKE